MNLQDRFRGAILGLACGDAVGTTLEFKRPGTFEPITDMVGGGPFKLEPGQWTDDTSMMLCLGTCAPEKKGRIHRRLNCEADEHLNCKTS